MTLDEPALVGALLAGYRVIELAGRGGTGVVYRARDERLDRDVALKVLSAEFAADPAFRARLVRESQHAASLDHPNVIPVYDAGEAAGHVFIAMRYVDGTDLAAEIRSGQLTTDRVVDVAAQVADALDAAHEQGLVHRDVKPSNVLIDPRGHCYLSDFGLSRTMADPDGASGVTLVGSVDYVSPEQIRGAELDGRADLYSLACMIFEMLTGQVPFPNATDVGTLFAHLDEDPPQAHLLRPDLPGKIDDVLARGLAKEPDDRQADCRQLVDELRAALGVDALAGRGRWRLAVAAVAVVAMAATAVLVWAPWRTEPSAPNPAGALVLIDPATNGVAARQSVPGYPSAVASTPGGIWTADFRDGVLWRFDPESAELQRIPSPGEPRDLAVVGDDVYVASDGPEAFSGNVSRHDARTGRREEALTLLACAIGSEGETVWVAGCPNVQRISTDGGPLRELAIAPIPFANPLRDTNYRIQIRELAVGSGSVWVLGDAADRRLWRLDALTGATQATIDLPFPPRSIAVADGTVWITDSLGDTVVPVDAADNWVLAAVPVGRGPAGVATGAGAVWVANALDGTVSRLDPGTRQVAGTVDVGGIPREVFVDQRGVWVTTHAN